MYLMEEEKEAMSNATTREERKAIYKETRRNVGDFINMVKSTASATPYKFRRGTVDEEGVRTTGTFAQDFVIALARVKGLSSNDLERGILSAKDTLKEGESLDFTDIDTLNLIAKAGKLRGDRLRKALKRVFQKFIVIKKGAIKPLSFIVYLLTRQVYPALVGFLVCQG